ncbi:MAG: hypothetical protein COB73_08950 [Flavobacteriaceae bacterium]|nr:MAG: hypothetical protein COB73_08950 [Flavobacteriaceae bacterium]
MRLFTKCKSCNSEILFRNSSNTRVELEMDKGESISLICSHCNKRNDYVVNEIYTKPSKILRISGTLFFLTGTPIFAIWMYYNVPREAFFHFKTGFMFGLLAVPLAVSQILSNRDRVRVNSFNNYYS